MLIMKAPIFPDYKRKTSKNVSSCTHAMWSPKSTGWAVRQFCHFFFQDLEGNTSVKSHLGNTFSSRFLSTTRGDQLASPPNCALSEPLALQPPFPLPPCPRLAEASTREQVWPSALFSTWTLSCPRISSVTSRSPYQFWVPTATAGLPSLFPLLAPKCPDIGFICFSGGTFHMVVAI